MDTTSSRASTGFRHPTDVWPHAAKYFNDYTSTAGPTHTHAQLESRFQGLGIDKALESISRGETPQDGSQMVLVSEDAEDDDLLAVPGYVAKFQAMASELTCDKNGESTAPSRVFYTSSDPRWRTQSDGTQGEGSLTAKPKYELAIVAGQQSNGRDTFPTTANSVATQLGLNGPEDDTDIWQARSDSGITISVVRGGPMVGDESYGKSDRASISENERQTSAAVDRTHNIIDGRKWLGVLMTSANVPSKLPESDFENMQGMAWTSAFGAGREAPIVAFNGRKDTPSSLRFLERTSTHSIPVVFQHPSFSDYHDGAELGHLECWKDTMRDKVLDTNQEGTNLRRTLEKRWEWALHRYHHAKYFGNTSVTPTDAASSTVTYANQRLEDAKGSGLKPSTDLLNNFHSLINESKNMFLYSALKPGSAPISPDIGGYMWRHENDDTYGTSAKGNGMGDTVSSSIISSGAKGNGYVPISVTNAFTNDTAFSGPTPESRNLYFMYSDRKSVSDAVKWSYDQSVETATREFDRGNTSAGPYLDEEKATDIALWTLLMSQTTQDTQTLAYKVDDPTFKKKFLPAYSTQPTSATSRALRSYRSPETANSKGIQTYRPDIWSEVWPTASENRAATSRR